MQTSKAIPPCLQSLTYSAVCAGWELTARMKCFYLKPDLLHKGKTMLMFSMVRQFSDSNDEPIQIHTDIIYNVDINIRKLSTCSWHDNCGDFIQTVLLSKAFEKCKNLCIEKLDIRSDRT